MNINIDDKKLGAILLQENYISKEDLDKAQKVVLKNKVTLLDYLVDERIINKNLIGQAIAESLKVNYFDLSLSIPSPETVRKIPEEIAKKYHAVMLSEEKDSIVITTDNPESLELTQELGKLFSGKKIKINYSFFDDINLCFISYQKSLETRFSKIIENKERVAPEILEEIFDDAIVYHASDIHFEPRLKDVIVRFRVDGVLHEAGKIPKEYYENILNRIKVQSGLRIDEHFSTQDGSLQYNKDNTVTDLRTSIVPTVEGEKVVLRVLSAYVQSFSLDDLGLSPSHQEILTRITKKPFGMILVVGPTGSGKTTTLYALLKLANKPDINIMTIEDPVEYKIIGINQIQTNSQIDLTFNKGLRSIVRQDPDIILVGEIRDKETAEIAVNAALTGHLLYSTFHANDAATAIPRLLDMGVESFLLASTLEVIIAQRLVRKICEHCKYSVEKNIKSFEESQYKAILPYFDNELITVFEGKKCDNCNHTGYKGRIAIFEFIQITGEMQNLMLKNPSTKEIWELARKEGSKTLFEDGIEKVKLGVTTIEELLRTAEPPQK